MASNDGHTPEGFQEEMDTAFRREYLAQLYFDLQFCLSNGETYELTESDMHVLLGVLQPFVSV